MTWLAFVLSPMLIMLTSFSKWCKASTSQKHHWSFAVMVLEQDELWYSRNNSSTVLPRRSLWSELELFLFDQTNIFVLTTSNTTTSTAGGLNINTKPQWHLHFLIGMNTFHILQHKPKAVSDKRLHLNSLWITRISQKPQWKPSAQNTGTFTFTHTLLWYYETLWVFAENVRVVFFMYKPTESTQVSHPSWVLTIKAGRRHWGIADDQYGC